MTEIKSKIQNLLPFKREGKILEKTWRTSLCNPLKSSTHYQNQSTEWHYHNILCLVKRLYSESENQEDRKYFERDYRNDATESSLAMYSFLTQSFYWHLECNLQYQYCIEYDFFNCSFEGQLMDQIQKLEHYSPGSYKHWQTKPNCKEFFERVIQVQDAKFINILPQITINY